MSVINQVKITGHYRDLAGNIPVGKYVRFRPVNSIGVPNQPIILSGEITKAVIDVNGDLKALDGVSDFYLLATNFTGSIPNSTYVEVVEGFGTPEPIYYLLVDFNLSVIDLSTVTRNSFIPISTGGGGGSSGIIDIAGDSNISVTNPSGPHVVLSIDLSLYSLVSDLTTHSLVKASSSQLGHIRVGTGLAIDGAGILSATNSGSITQINGDSVINVTNPNGPTTSLSFIDSFLHSLIASSPFNVDITDPRNPILTIDLSAYATSGQLTTHANLVASSSQLGHIKVGASLSIASAVLDVIDNFIHVLGINAPLTIDNTDPHHPILSIDLSAYTALSTFNAHANLIATSTILGHIKVGSSLSIASGVVNVIDNFVHSVTSDDINGNVTINNTDPHNPILNIDLSAFATHLDLSDYLLDTTFHSIFDPHVALIASSSVLGHIKVGSGLSIDGTGVLSATSGGFPVEPANTVYAGPTSGANAIPTFRSLIAADLPSTIAFNNADNNFPLTDFISGSNYIKLNPASPVSITLFNAGIASNTMSAGDLTHMEFDHGLQVHGSILGVTTIDIDDLNIEKATAGGPTLQIKYSGVDWFIWQVTSGGMLTFVDTNSHQVMSFGGGFSSSYPEQVGIGRQTTLGAKLHIQGSNDIVTTIIQRFATQTADILDIKDDSNALLFGIDVNGQIKTANLVAATTPGLINSKLPIYNASGTLIGYIPIYTTIT